MAAPSTAQISLTISGKQVWVDPPNFVSLSIERLSGDSCNSFTLQVLDDSAFSLEYTLLNNTGGNISFVYNDYAGNVFKSFTGYVIKMSDSFVDNRVMLTLEGFIGVSLEDKFGKYSFSWNIVPKFNWEEIFDGVNSVYVNGSQNIDGSGISAFSWFIDLLSTAWNDYMVDFGLKSNTALSSVEDAKKKIGEALQNLKKDDAGNYYLPKMKEKNYNVQDTRKAKNVKQSGSIVIPMRPSKIIKLIGRGGDYSELLEPDLENYKGTSIYDGDNKLTQMDWEFVKQWFSKMGKFKGCGWKIYDANIENTDLKETDLTQTKQSFLEYINKVLIPNSTLTRRVLKKDSSNNITGTTFETRGNYMLSFDTDNTVHYKRLDITNSPKIKATYYVYGNGTENLQNPSFGNLMSLSVRLDVLTSMITANTMSGGDISQKNLITGEDNTAVKVEVDLTEDDYLSPFKDWSGIRVSVADPANSKKTGKQTLENIQKEALKKCYEATATIEGPCNLSPQDYISICVIPKDNQGGGIIYHHTSGNYYIIKIEEKIDSGRQYSTLSLIKNVASIGTTGTSGEVALGDFSSGEVKLGVGGGGKGSGGYGGSYGSR